MSWTIQQRKTIRTAPRRKPDVWALPFANEPRSEEPSEATEPAGDPQPWPALDEGVPDADAAPEPRRRGRS